MVDGDKIQIRSGSVVRKYRWSVVLGKILVIAMCHRPVPWAEMHNLQALGQLIPQFRHQVIIFVKCSERARVLAVYSSGHWPRHAFAGALGRQRRVASLA